MTRRSFLFLALIFALILSVSSVAFAGEVYSYTNGDVTVELSGSDTFNNKVDWPFYENGKFVFIINSPINSNDAFYENGDFGVQIKVAKPDNASITKYSITESGPEGDFTVGPYQIGTNNCADQYKKGINISELSPWQQYTRTFDFTINWKDNNDNNVGEPVNYKVKTIIDYKPATSVYALTSNANNSVIEECRLIGGSTLASSGKVSSNIQDENGTAVIYTINNALQDTDWQGQDGNKRLRVQTIVRIPQNENIYHYKLSLDGGWESEISSARNPQGQLYGGTGDGYTIDEWEFENGDNVREYTYHWLDENYNEVASTSFTIKVRYPAFPIPVHGNRIIPEDGKGGAVYNGSVVYPVSETDVTTLVERPGELAVSYSIDNGEAAPVPDDGKIVFSTNVDSEYIISWYDSAGSLLNKESLEISFFVNASAFESIPAEWLTSETINGLNGVNKDHFSVKYTVDEAGIINSNIIFEFDLTKEDWQNALMQSVDTQAVVWPYGVYLPVKNPKVAILGTGHDTPDDDAMLSLRYAEYRGINGNQVDQFNEIANVSYDGSTAIITPLNFARSHLLKYMNGNVEHFHRVTVEIKHKSNAAVKISSVSPDVSRLDFNVDDPGTDNDHLENVSETYVDGTVSYSLNTEPAANAVLTTSIKRPAGSTAEKVKIFPQSNDPKVKCLDDEGKFMFSVPADNVSLTMNAFRLQWLDNEDKVLQEELISIVTNPAFSGMWMDNYWVPIPAGNVKLIDGDNIAPHFKESSIKGLWEFEVDKDAADSMDIDRLSSGDRFLYITPPEGAAAFNAVSWHSPMYDTRIGNETTMTINSMTPTPIEDANGPEVEWQTYNGVDYLTVYIGGRMFTKTELEGTTHSIYTVNETMAGYSDSVIIQWYDEKGKLITYDADGGYPRHGQYIHVVKKPYMKISETEVLTEDPTERVSKATAVVKNGNSDWHKKELRCEIPLQEQDGGEYTYSYMKLTLWDEYGNEVKLDPGTKLTVYIPYPDGITHQDVNANKYEFKVIHYLDDNHTESEELSLRAEGPKGLAFDTTSLSPFLIGYKPISDSGNDDGNGGSSSSGGSGISVTYNGGNSFSTSNSAVPTSVEIDGVPVSFTGDGRSFTVGCIDPNAKWVTVKWNSTSVTTNFKPDATVSCINMAIPKTGDASVLMPVLMLMGALAIQYKKSSK